MEEYSRRRGKGVEWRMVSRGHGGMSSSITSGFTVDNLDSKTYEEAISNYERAFVLIRQALEENQSCCMDVEAERLHCVQTAVDILRRKGLL